MTRSATGRFPAALAAARPAALPAALPARAALAALAALFAPPLVPQRRHDSLVLREAKTRGSDTPQAHVWEQACESSASCRAAVHA